jgi:hypothetical protein
MSNTIYHSEPLKTAAKVLEDKEYFIGLWANCLFAGKLQDQETFAAYCDLSSYGPANDWNSKRSVARELMSQIQNEVLNPALTLYRVKVGCPV